MKQINEDFQHIEELIRKVNSLISPITVHSDFKWLMDKKNNGKFKEQYPKCVLPINIGRTIIYAPICNRLGSEDPVMIGLAHKLVCKLSGHEKMHEMRGELQIAKMKLEKIMRKFSKDIPKPTDMASKKAGVTIALNKIKQYNDKLKGM
jgi:hypothetical protein